MTQNLKDAGAVFSGKTNMDEFAMGQRISQVTMETSLRPVEDGCGWESTQRLAGLPVGRLLQLQEGLLLQLLGRIRVDYLAEPAAFTGIVGLKPTYGRCSDRGVVAFASSLDQAGPLTRDVRDAALMLEVMAGH